mmetsp:Transcript_63246/g.86988  ORF Transcript_63246/g.86988 Transcript_63246/m.86988 type:complete len:201 (-) Transcript_63246:586-1188(-)
MRFLEGGRMYQCFCPYTRKFQAVLWKCTGAPVPFDPMANCRLTKGVRGLPPRPSTRGKSSSSSATISSSSRRPPRILPSTLFAMPLNVSCMSFGIGTRSMLTSESGLSLRNGTGWPLKMYQGYFPPKRLWLPMVWTYSFRVVSIPFDDPNLLLYGISLTCTSISLNSLSRLERAYAAEVTFRRWSWSARCRMTTGRFIMT